MRRAFQEERHFRARNAVPELQRKCIDLARSPVFFFSNLRGVWGEHVSISHPNARERIGDPAICQSEWLVVSGEWLERASERFAAVGFRGQRCERAEFCLPLGAGAFATVFWCARIDTNRR